MMRILVSDSFDIGSYVLFQCEGLKVEFETLQNLYQHSQQERTALELELQRCKAELHKLLGGKSKVRGHKVTPLYDFLLYLF